MNTPATEHDRDVHAWCALASHRALVRLADGRVGRLVHYGTRSGLCKVLVDGRHERIAAELIEIER